MKYNITLGAVNQILLTFFLILELNHENVIRKVEKKKDFFAASHLLNDF